MTVQCSANEIIEENVNFLEENFEDLCKKQPISKETECGFFIFRGSILQRLASKKVIILAHGIVGCIYISCFSYFNGLITTLEKRYNIPSKNVGLIAMGYDTSSMITLPILNHLLARRNRPKWISFGIFTVAIHCFIMAGLNFLTGPGDDALMLTTEYGALLDVNFTRTFMQEYEAKKLCQLDSNSTVQCNKNAGSLFPQYYLFGTLFFGGIFGPLFDSLGIAYLDDNILKSKTPALISFSYFIKMFGPAFGYTVASIALSKYIAPNLTPIIDVEDPRWMGAWWLGWIIIGCTLLIFSFIVRMFPRELPRASVRRMISNKKENRIFLNENSIEMNKKTENTMKNTFKRLLTNKIYILITFATVFNFFGSLAYWVFTPKYIETQYRQSAAKSSFLTGTVALVFTAIGILSAGIVISKFKPSARYLAGWNILSGLLSAVAMMSYIILGCTDNDHSMMYENDNLQNCNCDYVPFYPICGENNQTYISPCHAGCLQILLDSNGTQHYKNCLFIADDLYGSESLKGGRAEIGWCPVDCEKVLLLFMIATCFYQFLSSSGRTSNFLISLRCVRETDKSVSIGMGLTFTCLFAMIPSPVFFGWLIDQTCVVWGKTCEGTGNCWFYDGKAMRYLLNSAAAFSVLLGTICDTCVWILVKDLKLFDQNSKDKKRQLENVAKPYKVHYELNSNGNFNNQ